MTYMPKLEAWLLSVEERIEDSVRRTSNIMRPATVTETDPEKGMVKVKFAKTDDNKDVPTNWLRYATRSGRIRDWQPPSKGEQVTIFSPSGEIGEHSWIMPGTYSDQFQRNHNKDGERRIQIDDVTWINIKDGEIQLNVDGKTLTVSKDKIEAKIGDSLLHMEAGGILLKSRGVRIEAPSIVIKGDIAHEGNNTQIGIHTDSTGGHPV